MDPARIAELLAPFLGSAQEPAPGLQQLFLRISTYIDILLRWNARINLTAIRNPEEIVTRHFGESLFAARTLFPAKPCHPELRFLQRRTHATDRGVHRPSDSSVPSVPSVVKGVAVGADLAIADIGSGPGFPGLPIKLWVPQISLTLIESNHKKAAFLKEVTRALTLTDVNIQNTRAETLSATFDVVTLRAVEHFETILPTAANLVAPSGRLALLIGSAQALPARAALPNLRWSPDIHIPQSRSRVLTVAHRTP